MTQRESDHWSIGEVLSLIQEEFPEVTISKIRFLESQGLISPERTPSGYRRFYQEDFERLQWILAQQRDHYLPLRVIRSRLESGDLEGANEVDVRPALPFDGLDPEPHRSAPRVGRPLRKPAAEISQEAESDQVAVEAPSPEALEATSPAEANSTVEVNLDPVLEHSEEPIKSDLPNDPAPMPTDRRGKDLPGIGRNAAMTKDELAEASGCSLETVIELERFGLLTGRTIGPTVLYDGEALTIAQLAAQFVAYGLEPRHLRTLKIGAEREVGLLSQVIEPMLHRRDAQAHEEAMETLDNMVGLTARLQAILVRQMVRELLPSQRG